MGARHFTELIACQLAHRLKIEVFRFTAAKQAAKDFKFCDQIRESARSAPANIAEGFGRFRPREFARFLLIAKGSLCETQNHLREALEKHYLSRADFARLWQLSPRALGATTKLHQYLARCPGNPFSVPGAPGTGRMTSRPKTRTTKNHEP